MTVSSQRFEVQVLGAPTRAWRYGAEQGEPLLLVHGFRGDHHGLEPLAKAIAAELPELSVIVPDLPGFGESTAIPGREHDLTLFAEWLRAFAHEVAPGGFGLLGHSFGSLVVSAAVAQGLRPGRLMLVNPISSPALKGPQAAMTQLAIGYYRAADLLPQRAARGLLGNPLIVRVMSEVMAKTHDAELRAWIHDQHSRYFSTFSDPATLLQAFRASVSHTVLEFADAFDMPLLIIAGERDDITPLPKQLELQHRVPGARLNIIPGTGHLVHYEAVDDAASFVRGFLRETQTDTGETGATRPRMAQGSSDA